MPILGLFPRVFLFVYKMIFCGFGCRFFDCFCGALGLVFGIVKGKEKSALENASAVTRVAFLVAFVAVRFV